MKQILMFLAMSCLMSSPLYAGQSIITQSEGLACIGDAASPSDAESAAVSDAKRKAVKEVTSYIQAELYNNNRILANDLLNAYANAKVKVLQGLMGEWYKEQQSSNDCYRVKLRVEIMPDEKVIAGKNKYMKTLESDPSCPLAIKVWMDKNVYIQGERMKIFMKANKPFYANVVYKQADSSLLQLLPNHSRNINYFKGGVVHEIPSGDDRYNLEVATPFGFENVTVYASTSPLGVLDTRPTGGFYLIETELSDIPFAARNVSFDQKKNGNMVAEFAEATASAVTRASVAQ